MQCVHFDVPRFSFAFREAPPQLRDAAGAVLRLAASATWQYLVRCFAVGTVAGPSCPKSCTGQLARPDTFPRSLSLESMNTSNHQALLQRSEAFQMP